MQQTQFLRMLYYSTVFKFYVCHNRRKKIDFEVSHLEVIAFVKERFHNAVKIDILGIFEGYSSLQIWPPQKIFQGRDYSGRMT